jgi:hypothetical protein
MILYIWNPHWPVFAKLLIFLQLLLYLLFLKEKKVNFKENNPKLGCDRSLGTIVLDTKTILNKDNFSNKNYYIIGFSDMFLYLRKF